MFELIDTEHIELKVGIVPAISLGAGIVYDSEEFKDTRDIIFGLGVLCFFLTFHIEIPKNN